MIVVWFSCGAASAVAAKLTLDQYGKDDVRVVNFPVAEEDDDNRRFLADVEKWIDHPIELYTNTKFPDQSAETVWKKRKFMSSPYGAPCTVELKKVARQQWEAINNPDEHVLGFTAEEVDRYERFIKTERDNVIPVLVDANMSKADCFLMISEAGLKLPRIYHQGYPNANCIGCVKATSPTYWNHVRRQHPDVFERRAALSRDIGARLVRVNNERIFLDDLHPDAEGAPMKNMQTDCGIFCAED